jgi:c-src tyrosine kinase
MPWFHGKISRELAESLLTSKEDGLFLVRESANYPGDYTLCVWYVTVLAVWKLTLFLRSFEKNIDHYHVQSQGGKLTIDEEVFFDSLEALIQV